MIPAQLDSKGEKMHAAVVGEVRYLLEFVGVQLLLHLLEFYIFVQFFLAFGISYFFLVITLAHSLLMLLIIVITPNLLQIFHFCLLRQ